jgi:hypothetical protein
MVKPFGPNFWYSRIAALRISCWIRSSWDAGVVELIIAVRKYEIFDKFKNFVKNARWPAADIG